MKHRQSWMISYFALCAEKNCHCISQQNLALTSKQCQCIQSSSALRYTQGSRDGIYTAADLDQLKSFPFLDKAPLFQNLKTDLSSYLAAAAGVSAANDTLLWWEIHTIQTSCTGLLLSRTLSWFSHHPLLLSELFPSSKHRLLLSRTVLYKSICNLLLCNNH